MLTIGDKKYLIEELKQRGFEHRVNASGDISIRRVGNKNFYRVESQIAKIISRVFLTYKNENNWTVNYKWKLKTTLSNFNKIYILTIKI
jgi:hypothetical protein